MSVNLSDADVIIVVEKGKILEHGSCIPAILSCDFERVYLKP